MVDSPSVFEAKPVWGIEQDMIFLTNTPVYFHTVG
jgi:hypothetical protein